MSKQNQNPQTPAEIAYQETIANLQKQKPCSWSEVGYFTDESQNQSQQNQRKR